MRSETHRILALRIWILDAGRLVDIRTLEYVSIMITASTSESTSELGTRSMMGTKFAEFEVSDVACGRRGTAAPKSEARC